MRIKLLPKDDATNGWSRILPERVALPPLSGHVSADWVVVGAGFAGLAAARRLAENNPSHKVIVLEAQEAGEGASGRNSGFAIDLPHNTSSSMDELNNAFAYMRVARAGIGYLDDLRTRFGIACDWNVAGRYHAAVSPEGVRDVLEPTAREMETLGEAYRWVEKDDLRAALGTAHFTAAVYTPGCVLLNPAALSRGLADTLPDNVTLYEHSPVLDVDYGQVVRLTTATGSVTAPKVVLAVNGLAPKFGFYKGRLLPFAAHASLTRPLTQGEREALGSPRSWGLTPANAFAGITMRYTDDYRLLIRQNIHYCPSLRQSDERRRKLAKDHKRLFHQRFPMLPNVSFDHTWTGFVCVSENGAPGFGEVAPGVYAAVCQNAVGVAKGTASGMLVADLASGVDNPLIDDMKSLGSPNKLPPRPFLDLGVRAKFAWEIARAKNEA